jgi:hypothetical protein
MYLLRKRVLSFSAYNLVALDGEGHRKSMYSRSNLSTSLVLFLRGKSVKSNGILNSFLQHLPITVGGDMADGGPER